MQSKNSFIHYQCIQNISESSFRVIDRSNVNIEKKHWQKNHFNQLLPFIVQWKSKSISFEKNEKYGIIKQIQNIQFSYLIYLRLDGNKIYSIQGINNISLIKLKKIWFNNNKIMNLTDFTKIKSPQLIFISLNNNPLNELNCLSQLNANNIQTLCLESCFTHLVCNNICWTNKLETKKLKEIWIQSGQRICQNKVAQALKQNYPQNKIWKLR